MIDSATGGSATLIILMSSDLLIKNGRVIDPANGIDRQCDVLVVDGRIAEVGEKIGDRRQETGYRRQETEDRRQETEDRRQETGDRRQETGDRRQKTGDRRQETGDRRQETEDRRQKTEEHLTVIDAAGKLVVPGLIDIHVHFREPGDEEEETIASGSAAAVAAGFTSVVCMPNTKPVIESETDVEYVHRKGRQARKTHVYTMGALTKGLEGVELAEMGMMAEAGALGFTDDGRGVQDPAVMLRALKYAQMFDVFIAQHCEDRAFAGEGVMNSGYFSTILGLPGIDALAEEAMLWRDIQLIRKVDVRYHAQHISTAGSVELIRAAKADSLPVTCEVTPHHLLLTEDCCSDYDTNYKVNPPLRPMKDIEALRRAVGEGLVDALATDHAPHLQSEKELEFLAAPFGIASLECALGLYVKALIEPGIVDWPGLISLMTNRPAKIIGIDKGTLGKGRKADITIINPDVECEIDVNSFRSKSRNCPYHGWKVKAKVEKTIVQGEVRFEA